MANLRISLVQTELFWEDKKANLDMLERKIGQIPDRPELIILPEMFSTGFSMNKESLAETMDDFTVDWLRKTAIKKGAVITGSMMAKDTAAGETKFYNRLIWMLPNGEFAFYDKRHLFAYGTEDQHFSAGNKRLITSVNGWKINLQICYDLRFPVWLRQSHKEKSAMSPEYDLLIVPANWPVTRSLAWKTLLQARAIENQCYVIGVNRTGRDGKGLEYGGESMVIEPSGEPVKILGAAEETFSYTLNREKLEDLRIKLPFWRDADTYFIQP